MNSNQRNPSSSSDAAAGILNYDPRDSDSRRRWSMTIGIILSTNFPIEVCHAIAAGGESHFINVAGPVLAGQQFKKDDLRRIYRVVCHAASLGRRPSQQEIMNALR